MKTGLLIITLMVLFGVVGHMDFKTQQLEAAHNVCHAQTTETIPTYEQCISNQLEKNNDK